MRQPKIRILSCKILKSNSTSGCLILGYNLDDLPYMAVTVNRDIVDSVSNAKIEVKSFSSSTLPTGRILFRCGGYPKSDERVCKNS